MHACDGVCRNVCVCASVCMSCLVLLLANTPMESNGQGWV